jgi:glycosyltransferase involved in cell wall biosynthesis
MLLENEPYPADVRVRNEAETLAAAGYRVTVLAPRADRRQPRHELIDGVEVTRFWLPRTPQSAAGFIAEYLVAHLQLTGLTLRCLARGADVVHVNNPPDTLGVLLLLARALGRRTVFDNHDLFPELFELRYDSPRMTWVLRCFQQLAFRAADLVLTTNESQSDAALAILSSRPEAVVVVRNGPRASGPRHQSSPERDLQPQEPAGARRRGAELLFLGALEPQDGVVALAQIVRALVDRHGLDARLTVVGAGSSRPELEQRCVELGVRQHVVFTGRVPHHEVPDLLAHADVCIDPAPCNELNHRSTMIKIAEYMAAGKPIVAFDLRETRRTAGAAALYAPCGDVDGFAARVAELLTSPALSSELTQEAKRRLPALSWERSAKALLTAYERLLDG